MKSFGQFITEGPIRGISADHDFTYRQIAKSVPGGSGWEDWGWIGSDGTIYRPEIVTLDHDKMARRIWRRSRMEAIRRGGIRFGASIQTEPKTVIFDMLDTRITRKLTLRYLEQLPADEDVTVYLDLYSSDKNNYFTMGSVHEAIVWLAK